MHELDRGRELDVAVARIIAEAGGGERQHSRRLPKEMRWFATSGIIVTSEPVRSRIVLLTRSRSLATSAESREMPGSADESSNGTTTPTSATSASLAPALLCLRPRLPCCEPAKPLRTTHTSTQRPRKPEPGPFIMIEIMRTNDLVLISFVEATLAGAGMRYFVADGFTSAMEVARVFAAPVRSRKRARRRLAGLAAAGLDRELKRD